MGWLGTEKARQDRRNAEGLEAIDTAEVLIVTNGPSSPGLLRPTGDRADAPLYVIMPMHVAPR